MQREYPLSQIKNHDIILKYKFIILDLTQYRTYASCGKAVIDQYLLPKIMQHLLELRARDLEFNREH